MLQGELSCVLGAVASGQRWLGRRISIRGSPWGIPKEEMDMTSDRGDTEHVPYHDLPPEDRGRIDQAVRRGLLANLVMSMGARSNWAARWILGGLGTGG